MRLISRNSLVLRWAGELQEEKYVGDDTFEQDAEGFLGAARFHIYSREAADSVVFEAPPALSAHCAASIAVRPLKYDSFTSGLPQRHGISGNTVLVDYVGSWELSGGAEVHRPEEHLYLIVEGGRLTHCVIKGIDQFRWRTLHHGYVELDQLTAEQRSYVISRLTDTWIFEDADEEMERLLDRWKDERASALFDGLPGAAKSALLEMETSWRELLE